MKNSRPTPLIVSIFISGLQLFSLAGLLASLGTVLSVAAPSGGPYGPQPQTYTLPPNAAHVYYVAPDGNPSSPGTTLDAPTTLDTAIARAVTDDAINVYARPAPATLRPLIVLIPANTADSKDCTVELPTPEALTKLHPQFEIRSRLLPLAPADVFENPAQQNYRLNRALTIPGAAPLPDDIQNLLNAPASQNPAPGACQPQQ